MLWTALMLFGLAIALWHHSHTHRDDVGQVLELTFMAVSLIYGFAIAPLFLKLLLLILLMLYPTHFPNHSSTQGEPHARYPH